MSDQLPTPAQSPAAAPFFATPTACGGCNQHDCQHGSVAGTDPGTQYAHHQQYAQHHQAQQNHQWWQQQQQCAPCAPGYMQSQPQQPSTFGFGAPPASAAWTPGGTANAGYSPMLGGAPAAAPAAATPAAAMQQPFYDACGCCAAPLSTQPHGSVVHALTARAERAEAGLLALQAEFAALKNATTAASPRHARRASTPRHTPLAPPPPLEEDHDDESVDTTQGPRPRRVRRGARK